MVMSRNLMYIIFFLLFLKMNVYIFLVICVLKYKEVKYSNKKIFAIEFLFEDCISDGKKINYRYIR